jgi:hypothetical protein
VYPLLNLSSIHYKGFFLLWLPPILRQGTRGSGSVEIRYGVLSFQHKGKTENFHFIYPQPFSSRRYFRHLIAIMSPYKPQTSVPRRVGLDQMKMSLASGIKLHTPCDDQSHTSSCSQLHITHSSNPINLVWKVSQIPPE